MDKPKKDRTLRQIRQQLNGTWKTDHRIIDFGFRDPSWIPPKPKYTINEIIVKARRLNMTYGKYVAMMYERGIQL